LKKGKNVQEGKPSLRSRRSGMPVFAAQQAAHWEKRAFRTASGRQGECKDREVKFYALRETGGEATVIP